MKMHLSLVILCVLSVAGVCSSTSAPGNPRIVDCRSPEKETFACWWEPGSDGGLPTEYHLYYEREKLEGVQECPDYVSAGTNSCFFNKEHTSFWAEYNLRVVATNALGNASSEFLITDVMEYVKPDPPVNLTVVVNSSAPSPYLQVKWKSPPNVDVRTGWVTPKYELRYKQNHSKEWEVVGRGIENNLNLHNVEPGVLYMIQVRCNLDHGKWSEWSNTTFAKIPKYHQSERYFWILVFVFSLIPLLATIAILVLKRKVVKLWLLPPVPGPKIIGVDSQLLKSGRSEDVVNALIGNQNFPPMTAWTDQVEDYLMVSDSDELLLTDPYASQKKKDIFIIPPGLHLGFEIQYGESTMDQNTWEKTEDSKDETDHFQSSNVSLSKSNLSDMEQMLLPIEKQECLSVEKAAVQPLANSSYVDIQQHEKSWENRPTQTDYSRVKEMNGETILILNNENIPYSLDVWEIEVKREVSTTDNYSRVKEVNSDVVFLEKHDSADSYCKKKDDHYTDWTSQQPTMPHESEHSKGLCLKMIGSGYVDSVPAFSVK